MYTFNESPALLQFRLPVKYHIRLQQALFSARIMEEEFRCTSFTCALVYYPLYFFTCCFWTSNASSRVRKYPGRPSRFYATYVHLLFSF